MKKEVIPFDQWALEVLVKDFVTLWQTQASCFFMLS